MNNNLKKTCYNCERYNIQDDWCNKYNERCEAWKHIGQEYNCCELKNLKNK